MKTSDVCGLDPRTGGGICVTLEEGAVARIGETPAETDLYLSPGFVDLQVNGCAGYDLNAERLTAETVAGLTDAMLARGVTCFAPTLITASEENLCARLRTIAEARNRFSGVAACVPFVHIEGPHISPIDGYRGAHSASYIRPPDIAEFDRWQEAAGGIVGMVTLSPHFENSCPYIQSLAKCGIHIAIGHTHASSEQIHAAVDAGARLATHLGNGIARQIPRHDNPLWSQLADDRLTATFIADGHHLPGEVLRVMLRAKGVCRSVLISDLVALAGMPPGQYDTPVGGRVELRSDGRLCLHGSQLLAGSTTSLAKCIGHVVREAEVSLGDAISMATEIPGQFAGGRGRLCVGSRADMVRFRWTDEVLIEDVWLAGECVFSRSDTK